MPPQGGLLMSFLFRPFHERSLRYQTQDRQVSGASIGTGSPRASDPARIGSSLNPFNEGAAARALDAMSGNGEPSSTVNRIGSSEPHRKAEVVDVRPPAPGQEPAPNGARQDGSGNTDDSRSAAPSTSADDPNAPGVGEPSGLDPSGNAGEGLGAKDGPQEVGEDGVSLQEDLNNEGPDSGDEEADEGGNTPHIQYLGVDEEEIPEHQRHYAFISAEDPNTRLETVEDVFNAYENLIGYKKRLKSQNKNLQSEMARLKQVSDGTMEELRTKINLYESELGEKDLAEMAAKKHMPEKFQGLSEEDINDPDELREFYRAEAKAKVKAEQEIEKREAKLKAKRKKEEDRAEEIADNASMASDYLEGIDHERLGVPEEAIMEGGIADEVIKSATVGEDETIFHVAHGLLTEHGESMKPVVELLIDGLSAKIHEAMDQQRATRLERIKKKKSKKSPSSTPPPSSGKQPPAYSSKVGEASGADAWNNAIQNQPRTHTQR
jgi:hypothetical protein